MSASLMVPGPALVMMTSEEGGRQQIKPTLQSYATGTEAGNANRPALVMITSEEQQRGEDGERERVQIGRALEPEEGWIPNQPCSGTPTNSSAAECRASARAYTLGTNQGPAPEALMSSGMLVTKPLISTCMPAGYSLLWWWGREQGRHGAVASERVKLQASTHARLAGHPLTGTSGRNGCLVRRRGALAAA